MQRAYGQYLQHVGVTELGPRLNIFSGFKSSLT